MMGWVNSPIGPITDYPAMLEVLEATPEVYDGQFGPFSITKGDRVGVVVYRLGLAACAFSIVLSTILVLTQSQWSGLGLSLSAAYGLFCLGLGVSLATIHIYMAPLHRALQFFWAMGCLGSVWVALSQPEPVAIALYQSPTNLLLGGWVFVALTGLFIKEAFCFNRLETKGLTFLVPLLLGGHWLGWLSTSTEQGLLVASALLFGTFAVRKLIQAIPPDIGDKSVFDYLKRQAA
jgi:uncharacterized integral membrane protein